MLTAVLLCTILCREVHAYDRVPDGQLFTLLHGKGQGVGSAKARASQARPLDPFFRYKHLALFLCYFLVTSHA